MATACTLSPINDGTCVFSRFTLTTPVRELGLYSYRILYEIKSDELIEVLAVIHKRQHLEAEEIPRRQ
ncbi:MAG: plasmid stabilization system protein ParE [Gammaproteobacteria bacterium]